MSKERTQRNLLPHSEAKVTLLKRYLEAYIGVISNDGYTQTIHITDFFCGVGLFENNKEGSPLVIARILHNLFAKRPNANVRISCWFNDADEGKISCVRDSLYDTIEFLQNKVDFQFTSMPFEKAFPQALSKQMQADQEKFFYFIDPYGYKDTSLSQIKRLLDGGQSEVLLFQPCSHLFRFSQKGTPPALGEFLADLCPDGQWLPQGTIWEHIEYTTKLFRDRCPAAFVDSFTIQKETNTVYALFFFTPHIRGFEKMLAAKWGLNKETGRGWHFNAALADDLFSQGAAQTNLLEGIILEQLKVKPLTNHEIYTITVSNGFLPKHAKDVLQVLEKNSQIEVEGERNAKGFYLNYKEFRDQTRIIKISLLN